MRHDDVVVDDDDDDDDDDHDADCRNTWQYYSVNAHMCSHMVIYSFIMRYILQIHLSLIKLSTT